MKLLTRWQEQDLNIHVQDLKQHLTRSWQEDYQGLDKQRPSKVPKSIPGYKKVMGSLKDPQQKKTRELPGLCMNHLRCVTRLFTGHVKDHLFKLGLVKIAACERCHDRDETASHILSVCHVLTNLRFREFGLHFIKPSDYLNAPSSNV